MTGRIGFFPLILFTDGETYAIISEKKPKIEVYGFLYVIIRKNVIIQEKITYETDSDSNLITCGDTLRRLFGRHEGDRHADRSGAAVCH